jgi:hypothetical protein
MVRSLLPDTFDWRLLERRNDFDHGMHAWVVRSGHNFMPFHNTIGQHDLFRMPAFNPRFDQTFAQITDGVCQQLYTTRADRPWLVLWSGGIDSTVIVSSLLRNLSAQDRQNITICCNHASILEYPRFFVDCIQPNFRVMDSAWVCSRDICSSHYVINGEPGDQLFSHRYSRFLGDLGQLHWQLQPDPLIDYIAGFSDPEFARWVYEGMATNLSSVDIPVITYRDWCWWLSFNLNWIPALLRQHANFVNPVPLSQWLHDNIHWFRDPSYQQWSMHNNHMDMKGGQRPGDDKIAAKQYINSVYPDHYYLKYKTKVDSTGRLSPPRFDHDHDHDWVGIMDDYSYLRIDSNTNIHQLSLIISGHCR